MVAKFLDPNKPWPLHHGRKKEKNWHVWLSEHECSKKKISNNFHRKRFTFIGPVLLVHSLLIAPRFKKVAHTFLPSFDNGNSSLCLKILWRSRNFATMVTWRHSFSLSKHVDQLKLRNYIQSLWDWGRAKHIVVSIVKVISFTIRER